MAIDAAGSNDRLTIGAETRVLHGITNDSGKVSGKTADDYTRLANLSSLAAGRGDIVSDMKTLIILLLLIALLGGAALSRPSQDDFKRFMTQQFTQSDKNPFSTAIDQVRADAFVNSCTVNNRILWSTVQRDGHTLYTGAFAHWFSRADISQEMNSIKTDMDAARGKLESVKIAK